MAYRCHVGPFSSALRRPGVAGPLPKAPGHTQPHPLSPVCHADIGMGRL